MLLRSLLLNGVQMPVAYAPRDEGGVDDGDAGEQPGTGSDGDTGADDGDDSAGDDSSELPAGQPDGSEDDGEPEEVAGATLSRGQTRHQRLANEARTERERASELERERETLRAELAAERAARQAHQQQQTAQQEAERLAIMTPEERVEYRLSQMQRTTEQTLHQNRMQMQAVMDKTSYDAKAAVLPVYKKHAAEVERLFQQQMREGRPVERETLLAHLLGKLALASADKSTTRARRSGAQRVNAQTVRASSAGSDTPAARRAGKVSTAEQRLRGVQI